MLQGESAVHFDGSPPAAAEVWILWDAEVVSGDDYAALVTACGDLVRASGGLGVERLNGEEVDLTALLGGVER